MSEGREMKPSEPLVKVTEFVGRFQDSDFQCWELEEEGENVCPIALVPPESVPNSRPGRFTRGVFGRWRVTVEFWPQDDAQA